MQIFETELHNLTNRLDPTSMLSSRHAHMFAYPIVRLGSLLAEPPAYGSNEPGVDRTSETSPRYIRIGDIDASGMLTSGLGMTAENLSPNHMLKDGDLLLARSGNTVGKAYLHNAAKVKYDCYYAGYLIRFRFSDKVLPGYVLAFAQTSYYKQWISAVQRSAGQPNINAQEYCDLWLPLPPLAVQQKIIDILESAYEKKLEAVTDSQNLRLSIDGVMLNKLGVREPAPVDDTLETRIFAAMSSDLVGGRFDALAHTREHRLFLKNAQLGNFDVSSIANCVSVRRKLVTALEASTYIGLENVDGDEGVCVRPMRSNGKKVVSAAVCFRPGEVLVSRLRPYLNKVWMPDFSGVASTEFLVLEPQGILPGYLAAYLRLGIIKRILTSLMTGNTLPRVQVEDVLALPILIPPESVQSELSQYVSTCHETSIRIRDNAMKSFENAVKQIEVLIKRP